MDVYLCIIQHLTEEKIPDEDLEEIQGQHREVPSQKILLDSAYKPLRLPFIHTNVQKGGCF